MSSTISFGGSLLAALGGALLACAAGCSAGSDIYVEPTKTERTSSGLCGLTPDQDVCARTFDLGVGADEQARFVGFLESVTAFAAVARAARDDASRACEAALDALGAPRPTFAVSASAHDVARALCSAAEAAVKAQTDRDAFTLNTTSPACARSVPPPACALDRTPRTQCAPTVVTLTMNDGSSVHAQAVGAALLKSLGLALDAKSRFEVAATLSSGLTAGAPAGAEGGDSALAVGCRVEAVKLVDSAISEITLAAQLSAELVGAIQSGP